MHLTSKLLQEISFQICRGNLAYGLLITNEYLSLEHPLRQALALKARMRLGRENSHLESVLVQLLEGHRAQDLIANWREVIGPKTDRYKIKNSPTPGVLFNSLLDRRRRNPQRTRILSTVNNKFIDHAKEKEVRAKYSPTNLAPIPSIVRRCAARASGAASRMSL